MIKNARIFFENATGGEEIFSINPKSENLLLEVDGATSTKLRIQGRVDMKQDFYRDLAIIDMSNYDVLSEITKPGKYMISVLGIRNVNVIIDSVSGGALHVYGLES